LFLVVSYFVITVAAEDIYQGAGTPPDVLGDAAAAFANNSRISDMYAWAVINFFDYQFAFGPDTVFRLIDLILALTALYLMTLLALQRRPRLRAPDAATFSTVFLAVFLTWMGRSLYSGFSVIHNYLLIAVLSLVFLMPFIYRLLDRKTPESRAFNLAMALLGFLFGFSTNVTPAAFAITALIVVLFDRWRRPDQGSAKSFVASWRFWAFLGLGVSTVLMYVVGAGVSAYQNSPTYLLREDYISLAALLSSPISSGWKLLSHFGFNALQIVGPLVIVGLLLWLVLVTSTPKASRQVPRLTPAELRAFATLGLFICVHTTALSQVKAQARWLLPAYMLGVVGLLYYFRKAALASRLRPRPATRAAGLVLVGSILVTVYFANTAIAYHRQIHSVLWHIKQSPGQETCVTRESVKNHTIRGFRFGQADMLGDWVMPATIYGKTVYFCD